MSNAALTMQENVALKVFNSLALPQQARYFCEVNSAEQIEQACSFAEQKNLPVLILGSGSNIVFASDFSGVVIHLINQGYRVIEQGASPQDNDVTVSVAAGENWHQFVTESLKQQWYGLENLALIPGTVGAAPVQNIGAYGVELERFITQVEVYDRQQRTVTMLSQQGCEFSYRHSVFKRQPERYVILQVFLKLFKQPRVNHSYAALQQYLTEQHINQPSPQHIYDAVVAIRQDKLPDPQQVPNAGSFFKNPIINQQQYQQLVAGFPDVVVYPMPNNQYKIAAAWLIDQAGWKGYRQNEVGVHDKQALVLCNFNGGTGVQLMVLANNIIQSVQQRYGITLVLEPRLISA